MTKGFSALYSFQFLEYIFCLKSVMETRRVKRLFSDKSKIFGWNRLYSRPQRQFFKKTVFGDFYFLKSLYGKYSCRNCWTPCSKQTCRGRKSMGNQLAKKNTYHSYYLWVYVFLYESHRCGASDDKRTRSDIWILSLNTFSRLFEKTIYCTV